MWFFCFVLFLDFVFFLILSFPFYLGFLMCFSQKREKPASTGLIHSLLLSFHTNSLVGRTMDLKLKDTNFKLKVLHEAQGSAGKEGSQGQINRNDSQKSRMGSPLHQGPAYLVSDLDAPTPLLHQEKTIFFAL